MSEKEKKGKAKKEVTFTMGVAKLLGSGMVIIFLMIWVFILGVLTGRGDVNRLFQRLGLYKTDLAARLGVTSDNQTPAALPVLPPEDSVKALADLGKKAGKEEKTAESPSAKTQTVAKSSEVAAAKTTPDTAKKSGAPTGHEAKKPKGPTQAKPDADPSLASKLNFQNSLDTPTHKQSKTGAKKEGAAHTASVVAPSSQTPKESAAGTEKKTVCAYQVKVASYRTSEEAEKALADLKKKGFKVSLQQGKDTSGNTFTIKTGRYNTKSEAEKVTQKLKEAKINGQIQELKQ